MMRAYDNYAKTLSDWTSSINGAERRGIAIGEQRGVKLGEQHILDLWRRGISYEDALKRAGHQ
jgi:hypothetical protein